MIKSICILGRQPAIGLAELESLYGTAAVITTRPGVAGLTLDVSELDFNRLGSSTKLASVLAESDSADWQRLEKALAELVRSTSFTLPTSGKFHLGLSAIGFDVTPTKLSALALSLKKIIRGRGVSVRTVPNQTTELSSAQVYHNHLASERGAELLLIRTAGGGTIIARTVAVQDIDSYTLRDRGRPKRDARVGMLPPKLAQTIINLACGSAEDTGVTPIILDPFCGTGVVLQEALLMGYDVYGTDLDKRMVDYSRENIAWIIGKYPSLEAQDSRLENGDATTHRWHDKTQNPNPEPRVVACETYLGRPFTTTPRPEVLAQTISDVNLIIKKFLGNIHRQLRPGAQLCLAVPCWFVGSKPRHLPVLDNLETLGYQRIGFKHAATPDLIYHRENQIVGRELLVLTARTL